MKFSIDNNIKVKFTNTGHMLGSGVANLYITENGRITRIAYTGDIGRPTSRILAPPVPFPQADYLITESTYGDRLHEDFARADEKLLRSSKPYLRVQERKAAHSFLQCRTNPEIVYPLTNFSTKVNCLVLRYLSTVLFRLTPQAYSGCIPNASTMRFCRSWKQTDPFGFNSLTYITRQEDSKRLNEYDKPCIIISASGMMEAGRIKHHLANNISDPRTTILVVGYCSPVTLGARIARGDDEVSIFGMVHKVNAEVIEIDSFSGHGDYNEMMDFLSCQDKSQIRETFLVHGDYESQVNYAARLENAGFQNVKIPSLKQEFTI